MLGKSNVSNPQTINDSVSIKNNPFFDEKQWIDGR